MIDSSEKRNRQLAFELQNLHVCEKRSKKPLASLVTTMYSIHCFHNLSSFNQSLIIHTLSFSYLNPVSLALADFLR